MTSFSDDFSHDYFADGTYVLGPSADIFGRPMNTEGINFTVAPGALRLLDDSGATWLDPREWLPSDFTSAEVLLEITGADAFADSVSVGFTDTPSSFGDGGVNGLMGGFFTYASQVYLQLSVNDSGDPGDSTVLQASWPEVPWRAALPSVFEVSLTLTRKGLAVVRADTLSFSYRVPTALMAAWAARRLYPCVSIGGAGADQTRLTSWAYDIESCGAVLRPGSVGAASVATGAGGLVRSGTVLGSQAMVSLGL